MAKSNTIQFKGTFDGSQILNELKKVRASMSEAGASDTLFKNVDKDILATEKLVNDMMAQIQKGFSNTKEISAFEKQISKLQTNFLKISTGLKGANLSENFTFNSPEIAKLTQEINRLIVAQDRLKESSKNALAAAGRNLDFNQKDVKEIQKAVDANEDLEEALIRVAKAKEKATKANAGRTGLGTDEGRKYIKNANAGLSLDDLGATAMSGKTAKSVDDARARGAGGKLKRSSKGLRLDPDKAIAAVNETYQQALEETIINGGNAVEAVEAMKKAIADYGVELKQVEQLQENFAKDIENFYSGDIIGKGQKSAVTKAQKAGKTNAQGQFELSDDAKRQVVNNSQITAYNQNLERTAQAERELATERERLAERAEQAQEEYNNSLKKTDKNVEEVTGELREQASATRENVTVQEKMSNSFDRMKDAVKTFLSISSAVNGLKSVIRSTFEDVKNLDKSFAEIAMVTDYSVGQMWESYDQYSEMASKLGQSTQSVIQASGLFYQQGLNTVESLDLTEDTMKLATLAGTDFSKATSQMTAALRGFKMEMDEGNRVTDVYSELAAKAAADVQGIAYAMSKTASIAESAGMEFETTSAFLTQMIETTQEAPENIGTAMKTIIARFTELKENVAGTDKSEFDDLDYNKVDVALKSVGVSLKDASGQFRDLDDVFLELSGKWDTLDRNTQRYIATIAAGSRQQSRFIAMMDNYDRTVELVDTAYNSAGKSSEQFAKYQDTLEYKLNQLKNTWEQFRVQFFNSDFFKEIIDGLNTLLGKINDLDSIDIISIGATFLIFGKTIINNIIQGIQSGTSNLLKITNNLFKKIKNRLAKTKFMAKIPLEISDEQADARINALKTKIQQLESERIDILMNSADAEADISKIQRQLDQLQADANTPLNLSINSSGQLLSNGTIIQGTSGFTQADATALQNILTQQNITNQALGDENTNKQIAQMRGQAVGQAFSMGITSAITAYSVSDNVGEVFLGSLIPVLTSAIPSVVSVFTTMGLSASAAFTATGVGAIVVGIGAAIAGLTAGLKAFNKYTQQQAEEQAAANSTVYAASKEIERLTEKQKKLEEALQKSTEKMEENKKSYEGLIEGEKKFREYSEKTILSAEEKQEFLSVQQELAESYPELISYYDQEGNAILTKLGGAWDAVIEKKKEYYEKENLEYNQDEVNIKLNELLIKQTELLRAESIGPELNANFIQDFMKLTDANAVGSDVNYYYDKEDRAFYTDVKKQLNPINGIGSLITGTFFDPDTWNGVSAVGVLKNLSKAEKEQYGTLFSYALEMAESSIQIETGAAGIDDLISKFHTGNEDTENSNWKTFKKDLEDAKSLNLSSFKVAQQEAEQAFNESLESMISASAMTSDIYNNSSENVQKIMNQYILKEKSISFESELENIKKSEEYKHMFDELGNVLPEYLDDFNKVLEETFNDDFLKNKGLSSEDLQNFLEQNFDEKTKQALEDFFERTITKNGNNFIAQIKDMQSLDVDQSIKTAWLKTQSEVITAINERFSYIAGVLGEEANKINQETGEIELGGIYSSMISNFSDVAIETIDANAKSMNKNDFKEYLSLISSFNSEYQEELAQVDLSGGSYIELLNSTKDFTTKMVEQGKDATEAARMYNSFILQASKLMSKTFFNTKQMQIFRENIDQTLKNLPEDYDLLLKAQQEFQENSELSSETYYALKEAGFEKYVQTTAKGYQLLSEEVSKFYNQYALAPYEEYKQQIKTQEQTILAIDSQQIVETKKAIGYKGNTSFSYVEEKRTLQQAAEYYKENQEELQNYEGAYKDIIQEFVKSEDNWETFVKNLKEVNKELKAQEAQVYIQSLHTIVDAYDDAKKEVQELTDELADLTEQEEEDKKAKDEAYQAWQDAIHGSEDYQSSLDGLFNYEKRLDSLNDKLEETKEALSDISSIEEAKDLLQNTQSLYENKLGTLQAQNKVIDQSIKNLDEEILKNYGDFVDFDEFGNITVDTRKLEDADMSDILKDDGFTQLIEKRVEMKDKLDEGNKEILETEKAWNEQLKEARERQIAIEEKVIDILKEKMQEEIDATNEKYAALEEADNKYLDALQEAIDKQRELREQENQYEDLATKQKKLSLMQRDTSGANQKEVQSLEKEIEEDQQNLLDSEVDNLIESMRELYEKQQEARELEIEAMEAATENMQVINETALNIISGFQTAEDYQAWLMENDTSVEDMTITQTEAYLDEAKETFSGYAQYVALTVEDMALRTDEINTNADAVFENTGENVTTIGTTIQNLAEDASQKAIDEAQDAYDEAMKKWNETQDKIAETTNKLNAAEANAISTHQSTMDALVDASQSGMADVAEFAVSELAALTGLDLGGDSEEVKLFLREHNLMSKEGVISQGVYNAITAAGGDTSEYTVSNARYSLKAVSGSGSPSTVGQFATREAAEAEKQRRIAEGGTAQYVIDKTDLEGNLIFDKQIFDKHGIKWPDGTISDYSSEYEANNAIERIKASSPSSPGGRLKTWALNGDYEIFKTGGLVNYTGPAWVDGTPSKPEAFLSVQDTERIGNAAKLLADLPILNSTSNANNAVSSNIGDTSIEIHINVESLASDYDVDQMIERVKNDILDVSKPTGTSVILHK